MTDAKRKFYMFRPREDITVKELAVIFEQFDFGFFEDLFKKMPDEVQRHFESGEIA